MERQMAEQQVVEPVVEPKKAKKPEEKPPEPLSEQQVTDTYLEKRAKGHETDLPVPEPTIKPATEVAAPEEPTVDAYLAERSERKRKERGGKQAKIDELTRKNAELEEKAKAAETAKAVEPAKPKEEPAKVDAPTPEPAKAVEAPKAKPKMNEF